MDAPRAEVTKADHDAGNAAYDEMIAALGNKRRALVQAFARYRMAGIAPARSARMSAYAAIESERSYQSSKWGLDGADNPLTVGEFILGIEEQCAKARAAWARERKPEIQTLEFVRKIAGLAVNCMEQHGAPVRASAESPAEPPTSPPSPAEGLQDRDRPAP